MSKADDTVLVERCLDGNNRAYETLIDRYQGPIFNLALRIAGDYDSAKDIAQTAFIKAYEKLTLFDKKRSFFSWLYRIAVNEALNRNKNEKLHRESAVNPTLEAPTPEVIYESKERRKKIWNAIDRLKLQYRVIIVLKYFSEMSYKNIGYILDIPEKKVKSRLYTARNLLYDLLKDSGI